jgi:hypothetical protein
VRQLPECFKRFHDVICGASTRQLDAGFRLRRVQDLRLPRLLQPA